MLGVGSGWQQIAVLGKLRKEKQFPGYEVLISEDFEPATDESVGRAHTTEYIQFLHQLSAQVVAQPDRPVPFTPQVQSKHTHNQSASASAALLVSGREFVLTADGVSCVR